MTATRSASVDFAPETSPTIDTRLRAIESTGQPYSPPVPISDVNGLQAALDAKATSPVAHASTTGLTSGDPHTQYQKSAEKGVANGYAALDSGVLVPIAQLPVGTAGTQVAAGNHTHGASGLAASYVGYDAAGASWETLVSQRIYMKQVVLSSAALIASCEAYVQNDGTDAFDEMMAVLYEQITSTSFRLRSLMTGVSISIGPDLHDSSPTPRWVALPWAPIYVLAGTYYLAWVTNVGTPHLQVAYDASPADSYQTAGLADRNGSLSAATGAYSIRALTLA